MKLNSNTICLTKESEDFKTIEELVKKVASANDVENVESVNIVLSEDGGIVGFKVAQESIGEETAETDWDKEISEFQANPSLGATQQPQE